jgi:glycosyltransferase involved in cell wall biosynthesis
MKMSKVLHLWKGDSPAVAGGGGGSMFRLHSSLRRAGFDSRILCELKTVDSPYVEIKPGPTRLETFIKKFTAGIGLNDIHRISSWNLLKHPAAIEADIFNFHGMHSEFFSYLALPHITAAKATVITLRDLWYLTGHCAFFLGCDRWKQGCGCCPGLRYHPAVKRDATHWEWKMKQWAYGRSRLTLVALSNWVADQVRQGLLARFPLHVIPNGVDSESLVPLDQEHCRYALGIPKGKKIIMTAATSLKSVQKGGDLMLRALQSLPAALKSEILLLTVGRQGDRFANDLDMDCIHLGYVDNVRLKAVAFSAADLFVFPSRAESFGQVAIESFACGTPVVSHRVGPIPEIIRHGETGFLAAAEHTDEMGQGITMLIEDDGLREQMRVNCRATAVKEYSLELEAHRYIALYEDVLRTA